MRFAFIKVEKACHKVSVLCRVAHVSRAGFYAWLNRAPSKHSTDDARLKPMIQQAHLEGRRNYGRPMIHAALKRNGIQISAK
jgi:putative transposase